VAVPTGLCAAWVDAADVLDDGELSGVTAAQAQMVAMFASEVLYVLSNRYWPGVCDRTVRPDLHRNTPCRLWYLSAGSWTLTDTSGWWWGTTNRLCGYGWDTTGTRMRLPGPVDSVDSILIDGETLDPTAYDVEGRRTLIRLDGDVWPTGQDLTRSPASTPDSDGATPAWQVVYNWGEEPPESGVVACTSLLRELICAITNPPECRLPWAGAVATTARRGTTVSYQSLSDKFVNGQVGLADVDLWLTTAARGGPWRPRPPRIRSATGRVGNTRLWA
jgi:hypothetical protein